MVIENTTCWTIIGSAAAGNRDDCSLFIQQYTPIVRAYLAARWKSGPCAKDLDDAVQEVFVEFIKPAGILETVATRCQGGFRPFLYGVVRNVARHFETRRGRDRLRTASDDVDLHQIADSEESQSRLFDRTWALAIMREAAQRQAERAKEIGPEAEKRVELLRLRFHEQLPIREIPARWQIDAAKLHHEYARAREEFKAAMLEVVAFHHPGSPEEIARECAELQSSLSQVA